LAIQSFEDLLIHSLLPPKRELVHFKDQNLFPIQKAIKEKNKNADKILTHYLI
jgi:hypothetical protein